MTDLELSELQYAERNHGRNFVTALEDEPHNIAINRLTTARLFRDGGPSASGRWRVLTDAGRTALAKASGPCILTAIDQRFGLKIIAHSIRREA